MMEKDTLRFEGALTELENVVKKLEEGNLGLDEALCVYEQGMSLIRFCSGKLEAAEQKIKRIREENGTVVEEPFEEGNA